MCRFVNAEVNYDVKDFSAVKVLLFEDNRELNTFRTKKFFSRILITSLSVKTRHGCEGGTFYHGTLLERCFDISPHSY